MESCQPIRRLKDKKKNTDTHTHTFIASFAFPSEVTWEWRKLHNEELHDLYSSPTVVWVIKSRIR
jgi:hypothetical protein